MNKVTLCIPTLNPGKLAKEMVDALKLQTLQPHEILVIDSASTDGSIAAYAEVGAKIIAIQRQDFDHGGTRNIAYAQSMADVYVFMTQDAIPTDCNALQNLVNALVANEQCALVYGRQAPAPSAGVFARHARLYNYPAGQGVLLKSAADVPKLGIKTAFCSNSFAAYRRSAMEQIGFFATDTLFAEDSIAAAKLLQQGWLVAYAADAVVSHSHDYSLQQDFCRYFDVGAFHSMNDWYLSFLGKAEGEGMRFVRSEYHYLKQQGVCFALPKVVLRNGVRWMGYRVGRMQAKLPVAVKLKLTTNRAFWGKATSTLAR